MSENASSSAEPGEARLQPPGRERPRWVAFTVIVAMTSALVFVPTIVSMSLPPQTEGVVGVYERVLLQSGDEDRPVVGGFIAPQGWLMLDAEDDGGEQHAAGHSSGLSFIAQDGGVFVTVSMHSGVESSEQLLRGGAPIGTGLAQIRRLDSMPLVTAELLEYDLAAGSGVDQRIAVCEVLRGSSCLLFEVDMEAGRMGADDSGGLLPDIAAMVQSAEVQP